MNNLSDSSCRYLIENDTSTNFFVEAGAGSGKTTELVERMLAMVENGVNGKDIDISHICAITFTKAAANEFRDRFQRRLKTKNSQKSKKALENIDLCFMGTIDSFCNMIMSEHPVEGKIPANASVVDDKELKEIWINELIDIANSKYGDCIQIKYNKFSKYCSDVQSYFISGMKFLQSTKNCQFNYKKFHKDKNFEQIFNKELIDIKDSINFCYNNKFIFKQSNAKSKEAFNWIDKAYYAINDDIRNYQFFKNSLKKLCGLTIEANIDLDKITNIPLYFKNLFFQDITKTGKLKAWEIVNQKNGNPFYLNNFDNFEFFIAMDFILDASKIISDNLRKKGILSFADYLFYLKETLKEDAQNSGKLISYIRNNHKYFLIDEFQDTDPVQAEIFFYLTAKNLNEVKTWQDCIAYPGSLFIVGDPKQSIYRFRNADVSSYLNVKKLFENEKLGKVLTLTNNFRSSKDICKWFNNTFNQLLIEEPGIQSKFLDIPLDSKCKYDASLKGAYKYSYNNPSLKDGPACQNLCTIIKEIVNNPKYTIQNPQNKDGSPGNIRKVNYGDIMVITYNKSSLRFFMNSMRLNNIPFFVEGNVLFDDCPSLSGLYSLLRLIENPQDIKARYAVKFLFNDLFSIDDAYKYQNISHNMSISALISKIIDNNRLIALLGSKNAEYLYYAVELIREKEIRGQILTLKAAVDFIIQLINNNDNLDYCLQFVKEKNRVHIANLHKVKGLEAPVVIMAQASGKSHDPTNHVDYSNYPAQSYLFEVNNESYGKIKNWENLEKQELEQRILDAEQIRLLYVAATRAGASFIASDFKTKCGKDSKSNKAQPLLSFINNQLPFNDLLIRDVNEVINSKNEQKENKYIKDKKKIFGMYDLAGKDCAINNNCKCVSYKIVRPSDDDTNVFIDKQINNESIDSKTLDNDAAFKGTIVHRLMELIVNAKAFNNTFIDVKLQVINEFNIDNKTYIDVLNSAIESAKDLFDELKNAKEIYCEVPFCYKNGNNIYDGVIDLLYFDDKGCHIIDYKTNQNPNGLKEKYTKQLEQYKIAVKQSIGFDCTVDICHLKI